MNDFEKVVQSESSRRAFIARMGAAGLGAAAMALLAGCGSGGGTSPVTPNVSTPLSPTPNPTPSPTPATFFDPINFPGIVGRNYTEVVLNYALTLEIIEADLYRQALNVASGRAIGTALDANPPASGTGNYSLRVGAGSIAGNLVAPGFLYLAQYAYVEAAHRDFLRTALSSISGAPVANVTPITFTVPLGTTLESILNLIYAVEETGVRAYLGAAGFLPASDLGTITTAVAIHSTEARHSAAVAYVLGKDTGPIYSIPNVTTGKRVTDGVAAPNAAPYSENTFQYYSEPAVVIAAVTPFIAA